MGAWEAKIYINGENKISIKVKNGTELNSIRNTLNNMLGQISPNLYFISKNNSIIRDEMNFFLKTFGKMMIMEVIK